jgi:D-galactose 1-dehydrogenase
MEPDGRIRIALIGLGKIARDQHLPAIAANPDFHLVAAASSKSEEEIGLPTYRSHVELLAALPDLDAVAIATPPAARYAIARDCALAGIDLLLEKPPTATLGEMAELKQFAEPHGVVIFAAWHARFHAAVCAAAKALAGEKIAGMDIVWHEDVRKWHPGQSWIWSPGGFGVFDPGINALSIATAITPAPLLVRKATLLFPEGREAPIAARLSFTSPAATGPITASFDWRHGKAEQWTIETRTTSGAVVKLSDGGDRLEIDGEARPRDEPGEYPTLYHHFANLIRERKSDADIEPLRLVADAFLVGRREIVEPFLDQGGEP